MTRLGQEVIQRGMVDPGRLSEKKLFKEPQAAKSLCRPEICYFQQVNPKIPEIKASSFPHMLK
jgi:hypothetical protein